MSISDLSPSRGPAAGPAASAPAQGSPRDQGPAYPTVPLDLDAVDEEVAQGLTVRSLAGLVTAVMTGLVVWHLTRGVGTPSHMLLAAPAAALAGSVWTVRLGGASLPTWARRLVTFLTSPRLYAAVAAARAGRPRDVPRPPRRPD